MIRLPEVRVALVTDWFSVGGGGARVIEQILHLFPECHLFSLVDVMPTSDRTLIRNKRVTTSYIQKLPGMESGNFYRYVPIMPAAVESLDLSEYDLVFSTSHGFAKGVITSPDQLHICYCHSPLRFGWDNRSLYFDESNNRSRFQRLLTKFKKVANQAILHHQRLWDASTASRVDIFFASSHYTAARIGKLYRREATVMYPPIDLRIFKPDPVASREFYVASGPMLPYKELDVIVETFRRMPDRKLVVMGDGPEFEKLSNIVGRCPNISLLGQVPQEVQVQHLQRARAFITLAKEDFGLPHVEAQACGTPVIALQAGGALENVIPLGQEKPTGMFIKEATSMALTKAIEEFESLPTPFKIDDCRENAQRFSGDSFRHTMAVTIEKIWQDYTASENQEEQAA